MRRDNLIEGIRRINRILSVPNVPQHVRQSLNGILRKREQRLRIHVSLHHRFGNREDTTLF
jgi:hypothetical protein